MTLSESKVRAAKPGPKPRKLHDAHGLYLFVAPTGGKRWRVDYQLAKKRRTLSLGTWPDVGVIEARMARDSARKLLAAGVDPCEDKRRRKAERKNKASDAPTLKDIADEYQAKLAAEGRAPATLSKAAWLLDNLAAPLAHRPIAEITSAEVLAVLKKVENRGHHESARRLRSTLSRTFRYAIATDRATVDPTAPLAGALIAPTVKHRPAITEPKEIGRLLRAIDRYRGDVTTRMALKIIAHAFPRPGELRAAEWVEFDKAIWSIPEGRTKMRRPHLVPLSTQVLALLEELRKHTGSSRFLFPANADVKASNFLSEVAMNNAMRAMGFGADEMTAHGFRAMASTRLHEMHRWNPDAIERQLAHVEKNAVRAAYNRAAHWPERVAMMQVWSDYLDSLKAEGSA